MNGRMTFEQYLADLLLDAIAELRDQRAAVYTFAFRHNQRSDTLSVCADIEFNSRRLVRDGNRRNARRFAEALREGDLMEAALWQSNLGRNLVLGAFRWVDLAERSLGRFRLAANLHLEMARTLLAFEGEIARLAPIRSSLVLVCSTPDDEAGLVWAATGVA